MSYSHYNFFLYVSVCYVCVTFNSPVLEENVFGDWVTETYSSILPFLVVTQWTGGITNSTCFF